VKLLRAQNHSKKQSHNKHWLDNMNLYGKLVKSDASGMKTFSVPYAASVMDIFVYLMDM